MGCMSSTVVEQISIHEVYDFQDKLGQGAFGQVRTCVHRNTERECAVKILNVDGSSKRRAAARKEGTLWQRVTGHAHIVSLHEAYSDKGFSYFVMDKCERSLCDMLLKTPGVQETDLLSTFRQMLLALEHCHAVSVVHRDVKPANFLVSRSGTVQLCDFGLAELEKPAGLSGLTGTAPFMSPEMVMYDRYTAKTDIWSLGATAYLMLYGRYLYQIKREQLHGRKPSELMHRAIALNVPQPQFKAGKGLPEPSKTAQEFVQALLERNPARRPTATECLQLDVMVRAVECTKEKHTASSCSMAPAIKLAKQATAEFKVPVDPTVAKSMDQLIAQLQQRYRIAAEFGKSFSLPHSGEKSLGWTESQFRTTLSHGGEVSLPVSCLADDISVCSTTVSSGSSSTKSTLVALPPVLCHQPGVSA